MLEKDKIKKLKEIKKETEIHSLLYDLLKSMKQYDDVKITHENGNVPEYGKDLICSMFDSIEEKKEWTAFVVKKGNFTGASAPYQEIISQIKECFQYPFEDLKHGNLNISKVKVVFNGKITSSAKQKMLKDEFYKNPNISFWGIEDLIKHLDKNYNRYWLKGSEVYKHYVELFQKKNKQDDFTKAIGLSEAKIEKLLKNTIKPKLIEFYFDETTSKFKKKWFNVEDLNKINECKLIVGESGSGKTTLFKQISNNIIYENSLRNHYELYPIILKFVDLRDLNFDIHKAIKEYFKQEIFQNLEIDVDDLIKSKKYILFIDALDEVGEKKDKQSCLECVKEFNTNNPKIQIICSSRNSDSLLGTCRELNFRYFEINGVSIQQAESFLGRYFEGEIEKSHRLIKSLKDSRILEKLPKTPLTLTLLTSLFDENGYEIPATISDLYKYFIEITLNKSIKESHLDLLKVGVHKSVLSYVAAFLHKNRKKSIGKDELFNEISKFAKERGHGYNVSELINDLIQQINILIENDRGEIEFKHLSFQEYFTAYQFYNHDLNGKSNFTNNFNDVWWQNVALFYAGMTKDSPELIDEIIELSKPTEFHDYMVNIAGLGYLIQALYNTPMESRRKAVKSNLESTLKALEFILTTEDEKYLDVKYFLHTSYGAHKILAFWYEFHHSSITLKETLEKLYTEMIFKLKERKFENSEEKKSYEYSTYLIASSLINIEFDEFTKYNELINLLEKDNYFVKGLIDSDFNSKYKELTKEEKRRKKVKRFLERLSFLDDTKINKNVNISIINGKLLG